MTQAEKYKEALDVIQALLNAYGCNTPKWVKAREIIDFERPILEESIWLN